ncbi:GNAT family N-acetyltransferase [Robertmurraya siralis]|nr:hypothetical protein CHH80_11645 [Bacillus sp. 7504-2]
MYQYTLPANRGRGSGSLLLKAIEETARKNGFHKII